MNKFKNTLGLALIGLAIIACGTQQETEIQDEQVVEEKKAGEIKVIDTVPAVAAFLNVKNPENLRYKNSLINVDDPGNVLVCTEQIEMLIPEAAERLRLKLIDNYTGAVEQPFRVSIHFNVKDYATWRWMYDMEEKNRTNAGMKLLQLGLVNDNPNEVFILLAINDIATAREMMNKPALKEKMVLSGVIGEADVRFWRLP